jgi:hypothetical protein
MNKHTPAPWTVESDDGIDWTVLHNQFRIAVECSENNASLIAAAPDLLEALQLLLLDPYLSDPINNDRMTAARAAVARATGEAA